MATSTPYRLLRGNSWGGVGGPGGQPRKLWHLAAVATMLLMLLMGLFNVARHRALLEKGAWTPCSAGARPSHVISWDGKPHAILAEVSDTHACLSAAISPFVAAAAVAASSYWQLQQ